MSDAALKLTTYFGERDRADGGFLADAFTEVFTRHELRTSLVLRGMEGFGAKHRLRTDRLLTLSEDLPVVSVAVDRTARIEAALADLQHLRFDGLVTLERARLLADDLDPSGLPAGQDADEVKLTVYVGRSKRTDGRPAYEAVVAALHDHGVAGASVLLGVDGTAHGARERARLLARNTSVPLMVISVGRADRIAAALPRLRELLDRPIVTAERVRVCKRDGQRLAEPRPVPEADEAGRPLFVKLMVHAGEQSRADGDPLHHRLVRELRAAGALGATTLRGTWGYHGDHAPHGDSFWQLRRRVPVVCVVIDTPPRAARWFEVVDRVTARTGLVTSEVVPVARPVTAAAGA